MLYKMFFMFKVRENSHKQTRLDRAEFADMVRVNIVFLRIALSGGPLCSRKQLWVVPLSPPLPPPSPASFGRSLRPCSKPKWKVQPTRLASLARDPEAGAASVEGLQDWRPRCQCFRWTDCTNLWWRRARSSQQVIGS